jgi:hypothetical protein
VGGRPSWAAVLLAGVGLALARALLVALQDDYLGRGLPALALWDLARHFTAGLPWALVGALLASWGFARAPAAAGGGARLLRVSLLAAVILLGFAFVTSRAPLLPAYVPELESARGWAGNVAGLLAASLGAVLLVLPTSSPGWLRVPATAGAVLALVLVGARVALPFAFPAPRHAPFSVAFEDVTEEVGIACHNLSWAIAWGDFDGDARPDLWSSNHGSPAHLYANRGGRFERVSTEDLGLARADSHGAAWADWDGDGDQELLELAGARRGRGSGSNHLYEHEGGTFVERAAELGLDYPLAQGRTPLWLDWNLDGDLDVLLLCGDRREAPSALFLQAEGSFVPAGEGAFPQRERTMFGRLGPLTGPGSMHLVTHGQTVPSLVYDLRATPPRDVTRELGLREVRDCQDLAIADLDGDLRADLFVARRRIGSELLRENDSHVAGRFLSRGSPRGVELRTEGPLTVSLSRIGEDWWNRELVLVGQAGTYPVGVPFVVTPEEAAGSWDPAWTAEAEKAVRVLHDPETGLWSVRMHGDGEEVTVELLSETPITDVRPIGFDVRLPLRNAVLFHLEGGFGNGTDRALVQRDRLYEGLPREELLLYGTDCSGVATGDLDNDMDVDVYAVQATGLRNVENLLLENLGDGTFRRVPGAAGAPGSALGIADAVALADYDADGFLDLAVSNGRGMGPRSVGPLQLYRNGGNANHWLELDLVGTRSSREAIGAEVRVTAGGRTQVRFQGGGVHRGAQDHARLHFGLGPHERVDELVVHWPSGARTTLSDVAADQVLRVVE